MRTRLDLQDAFEQILGSNHVYFQPPESLKMKYPAIRYRRFRIDNIYAEDNVYKQDTAFEVTAIYLDPDSTIPYQIARLPKCKHDRSYVADNLYHDVFTIYI